MFCWDIVLLGHLNVGTFEKKVEKKNQKKKIQKKFRTFSKSIPIKVWPRQQKNKRKRKNN